MSRATDGKFTGKFGSVSGDSGVVPRTKGSN